MLKYFFMHAESGWVNDDRGHEVEATSDYSDDEDMDGEEVCEDLNSDDDKMCCLTLKALLLEPKWHCLPGCHCSCCGYKRNIIF